MVEYAGGINCISMKGEPSRSLKFDEVLNVDPEIIVFMPCGFSIERILSEFSKVESMLGWHSLKAVRDKEVYAVDANAYYSRPSYRVVRGIEILAKIIHPNVFNDIEVSE